MRGRGGGRDGGARFRGEVAGGWYLLWCGGDDGQWAIGATSDTSSTRKAGHNGNGCRTNKIRGTRYVTVVHGLLFHIFSYCHGVNLSTVFNCFRVISNKVQIEAGTTTIAAVMDEPSPRHPDFASRHCQRANARVSAQLVDAVPPQTPIVHILAIFPTAPHDATIRPCDLLSTGVVAVHLLFRHLLGSARSSPPAGPPWRSARGSRR